MLDAFEALAQIVSVVDRGEAVRGVELVVSPAESFGTALVRATGSADYVRALEPLPSAPDEAGVLRGARGAVLARTARAPASLQLANSVQQQPARAHNLVGRQGGDR